jgi:hypothetical protein
MSKATGEPETSHLVTKQPLGNGKVSEELISEKMEEHVVCEGKEEGESARSSNVLRLKTAG